MEASTIISNWNNDSDMGFYYEDLPRDREIDVELYDTKFSFWKRAIEKYQSEQNRPHHLSFKLCDLRTFFTRDNGMQPSPIVDVLSALVQQQDVFSVAEFIAKQHDTDIKVIESQSKSNGIWSPIIHTARFAAYSISSVYNYVAAPAEPTIDVSNGSFVFQGRLQSEAKKLYSFIVHNANTPPDLIIPLHMLTDILRDAGLDSTGHKSGTAPEDIELVLSELKRQKRLIEVRKDGFRVFCFATECQSQAALVKSADGILGEYEYTVAKLRVQLQRLYKEHNDLSSKISKKREESLRLLRQKKKDMALMHLKSKKIMEKREKEMYGKLLNLESIVDTLIQAQSNRDVLNGISAGNKALETMVNEMKLESIEELMTRNAELQDEVQEQSEALSEPIDDVSMSELEHELASMMMDNNGDIEEEKVEPIVQVDDEAVTTVEKPTVSIQKNKQIVIC